jgi:two-component system alkaline phosphatase synthesis response regulator PhoP
MDHIRVNELEIDFEHQTLRVGETLVPLTPSEFGVLAVLASRPGTVFRREQIVTESKGHAYPVTLRSIDVQVVGLRRKLGCFRHQIRTVRGVGYELIELPIEPADAFGLK